MQGDETVTDYKAICERDYRTTLCGATGGGILRYYLVEKNG